MIERRKKDSFIKRVATIILSCIIVAGLSSLFSGCLCDILLDEELHEVIRDVAGKNGSSDSQSDASYTTASWEECKLSSNWTGNNASKRMMNILSPHMPDNVFAERVAFMKSRGCDTAHLILCNKADGEYGGYCIYGSDFDWSIDSGFVSTMKKRLREISEAFHIVLWLTTDDSSAWNKEIAANPAKYLQDLKAQGILGYASIIVAGLEVDEYWSRAQASAVVTAIRGAYNGKVGIHHTSNCATYADLADILLYQIKPTTSTSEVATATKKALSYGKPVIMFEMSRSEDRVISQAALDAGAFGVGNW